MAELGSNGDQNVGEVQGGSHWAVSDGNFTGSWQKLLLGPVRVGPRIGLCLLAGNRTEFLEAGSVNCVLEKLHRSRTYD